jgi:hypothetical protein
MGFTDDFTNCITLKGLSPALAEQLPDAKTALKFAAMLISGTTVESALIAIGVGAAAAAEAAAAVSAFAVGVVIGAVVGCAGVAAGGSLGSVLAQLDPSEQSALAGPLATAGLPTSAAA